MEIKYQSIIGGRVGGVFPPYRDHHVTCKQKLSRKHSGLDTFREEHAGLLDHWGA
jgi:hypothetical protein